MSSRRRSALLFACVASSTPAFTPFESTALADSPDAGGVADGGSVTATCTERLPPGAKRPDVRESFPTRGTSGYAANFTIEIRHGKGERVLPDGFDLQQSGEAQKGLEQAGFAIAVPDGGTGPTIRTDPSETGESRTTIVLPVVPLPPSAGRAELVLPPLPIAIARSNNEYLTICTAPHTILVEEPIANENSPKVRRNPPPRRQREEWVFLKQLLLGIGIGIVLAVLLALLVRFWRSRPKRVAPPEKPLPWVVALAELEELRRSKLLEENKTGEYFDRVSECIRKYLGARYEFDRYAGYNGLEATTSEMRALLMRVRPPVVELPQISAFLDDCDLVKFARVEPQRDDCEKALERGESIVRLTMPVVRVSAAEPSREVA